MRFTPSRKSSPESWRDARWTSSPRGSPVWPAVRRGSDDVEMLEDLIIAALNNAYEEADAEYEEKMGKFGGAGGLL